MAKSKTGNRKRVLEVVGAVPATVGTAPRAARVPAARKARGAVLDLRGTARAQVVTAGESDVTDEIAKGGPAFGAFLLKVGEAVAESQKKLDETLVTTAKALSETTIDVIAVFEQQLKDSDGQMDKGNIQIQKLPLVNYLMPTAYNFSRVYLQADMKVSEFNGANGFNIKGSSNTFSASAKASYGLIGGFGASGGMSFGHASYQNAGEVSVSQDSAVGSIHMEATLEPRTNIELPRPFILQKGPKVQVRIDSSADLMGTAPSGGGAAPKIGRQLVIKATLRKTDGTPHSAQQLQVSISDPQFNRDAVAATDANGETSITIKNEWGTGATSEPARKQATVSVSFGLASQTIGISL